MEAFAVFMLTFWKYFPHFGTFSKRNIHPSRGFTQKHDGLCKKQVVFLKQNISFCTKRGGYQVLWYKMHIYLLLLLFKACHCCAKVKPISVFNSCSHRVPCCAKRLLCMEDKGMCENMWIFVASLLGKDLHTVRGGSLLSGSRWAQLCRRNVSWARTLALSKNASQ